MDLPFIPEEAAHELKFYVYRLIDPRNGETFYVGKGRGVRVLQHARNALKNSEKSDKLERIREIRAAGLEVGHVIHRHGIRDEATALEVEAAVMECFPASHNLQRGHHSGRKGCAHLGELIVRYAAKPLPIDRSLLLISIGKYRPSQEKSVYDQVRGCWTITEAHARKADLVLGHQRGLVKGVYVADKWLPATVENFPWLPEDQPKKLGFVGHEAAPEIVAKYLHTRIPAEFRKKGASNPIRLVDPESRANGPASGMLVRRVAARG